MVAPERQPQNEAGVDRSRNTNGGRKNFLHVRENARVTDRKWPNKCEQFIKQNVNDSSLLKTAPSHGRPGDRHGTC